MGSPHGSVRVYMSPALVAFRTDNPDPLVKPAAPGVMAVKEFFDEQGAVVGHGVIYYPDNELYYYCYGPADRCATGSQASTMDTAQWGGANDAAVSTCHGCHFENIYTELPE